MSKAEFACASQEKRRIDPADYYDVATFHWEQGEWDQAMAIAWESLHKAKGRLDELPAFVAQRK